MTVTGNDPGPYHTKGFRHCLDQIRAATAKAAIICHERGWDDWRRVLEHIDLRRTEELFR